MRYIAVLLMSVSLNVFAMDIPQDLSKFSGISESDISQAFDKT
jgi:hypothetical protein